ncbi:MAG: sigma-70 family RNA polymerase sigma factor [Chloroflexi bacterium]|nr:sigma-70 family RNA polymerase sigma factor [Chloroflexota bacterium]
MATPSDAELVNLTRSGSKAAFGILIERHEPMALRLAQRLVTQAEIARELAQEAFLQAYLSLDHLRDASRFRSWFYSIVLNVCRSYLREQKTTFFSLETLPGGLVFDAIPFSSLVPHPETVAEERDLERIIRNAITLLPPQARKATLLFYYEQLTLREVATILDISPGAVKAHLHHARKQLRAQLTAHHPEVVPSVGFDYRRKNMVKVIVADVVRQQAGDQPIYTLAYPQGVLPTLFVVILLDEAGRRALPIWIGQWEGENIALGLSDLRAVRPLTYNLMANLLQAAGVKIEEIRIEALKDETFYAIIRLQANNTIHEVDARPSDAIALALRTASPIYATEEVLQNGGVALPVTAGQEISPKTGKSLDTMLQELKTAMRSRQTLPASVQQTPEEREKAKQDLIAAVFAPQ